VTLHDAVSVAGPQACTDTRRVIASRHMLLRDVDNLRSFFGRHAPALLPTRHGPEIRALYAGGLLVPDMPLTGRHAHQPGAVDLSGLLREIEDARLEEAARLQRLS
jgi:RIO kinase 1